MQATEPKTITVWYQVWSIYRGQWVFQKSFDNKDDAHLFGAAVYTIGNFKIEQVMV